MLLQKDNTYRLNNLVDPNAAVYDNSDYIGSGAGFGNNLAAPGSSPIGHSSIFRATGDADFIKPSASYFLIQTDNPVNPGDMLDSPLDVPPTGVLHGAEFESWHVLDSIGAVDDGTTTPGEVAYAYLNFSDKRGTTNTFTPNSTVVPGPFTPAYVGRVGNTLGSVASDWVATDHLTGLVPIWGLGAPLTTTPASFGIRPLNHLGSANFDDSQPAVVATTPSTLNYTAGSGAIAIDTNVNVSDPDSYFLGGATVAITGNFDSTKDTLAFTNTAQIAATYSASTGVLTLSGVDTFDNYIAALRSVTYANSSTASAQPARTVSFSANDGAVLSNVATRVINIQASGAAAPVVGSAGAVLAYTENAAPTVISTGLTVTDAGATQILSATVSLGATYFAGQDELAVAPNFGITGSFNAGSGVLFLTGTASVANYQAILRTVTYFNSSDNPVTTARKATFAVVDADNTSSSTSPASASRAINITAVNDAPTIAMSAGAANYTAGNPASIVDPSLTAIDPDHANLTGAAVAITGNFSSGDELHFTNQLGITGSYNASTGVLTLTGASSVANYQTALRSVSYSNALAIPSAAARTISISATDGLLTSTPATKQISVEVVLQLTVVNTNDSGPGSLRQAILYANSDLGHPHTIDFDIPGGDLHVIQLASTLPDLASALTLLVSASEAIEIGTASAFSLGAFATLTKDGPGTLTIEHNQPNASPAVLNVSAGTLHLNGDGGSNLTVNDNATLKLGASQHLASLSIAAGATASLAAGGGRVLVTPSLSITSGGALDLANNDLVVQAFSATRAAVLTEVTGLVASGAANLSWAGLGINSSAAASDPASLTALGVMLNDNGSGGPFYTSFAGETVDENDILVKYTYYGDADLSGSVDGTDYALIDNGFNAARTGWFKGDFDYASLVDGTDYALIDNAFNSQSGPLSNVGVGPVPRAALPPLPDQDQKLVDFAIASIDIITDQERFEHIGPADDILALLAIGLKRRWRR